MIIIYFVLGFFSSIIGALPLGASNIIVINTTIKQNISQALKIAIAAGFAEIILSFYALHYNSIVQNFISENKWFQISIVLILLCVGGYLFFRKQHEKKSEKRNFIKSKYLIGFLSGLLNPPVLIYWLFAIGFINKSMFTISFQSSIGILLLFFIGIFFGKVLTLYFYSKFSLVIKKKFENITLILNKVTGVLLIILAMINTAKIYFI